jgi:hemerythrin-like domain-containing protein
MLVTIGPSAEPGDVVDLLVACHDRIRFFIDLALRLAAATDVSNDEIGGAAARIMRYFSESLPLHVADEEESILPRLSGRDPALDRTLEAMRREHAEHEPHLEVLLKICRALQDNPEELPKFRKTLHASASQLVSAFSAHLSEEEKVVLPAIRSLLSDEERTAMLAELRARRST